MVHPIQGSMLAGSALSLCSCTVVIWSYASIRELRRHPNSFILWRSVFDAIFSVLVLGEVGYQIQTTSGDGVSSAFGCNQCLALSMVTQFVLLASELVFLMLSLDLLAALTNPFVNYRANRRAMMAVVFILAVISACVLGFSHIGDAPAAGLTEFNICWVQFKDPQAFNLFLWGLFYIPIFIFYLSAVAIVSYAFYRLSHGLRATYHKRMVVFRRSRLFVTAYAIYWTIAAGIKGALFESIKDQDALESDCHTLFPGLDTSSEVLFCIFLFIFCAKGLVTMTAWLYTYDVKQLWLRQAASRSLGEYDVDEEFEPHLNRMLRTELLYYTRVSIYMSVKEATKGPIGLRPRHDYSEVESDPTSDPTATNKSHSSAMLLGEHGPPTNAASWHPIPLDDYAEVIDGVNTIISMDMERSYDGADALAGRLASMTTIIRTRPPLSVSDLAPRLFARIRKLYRIQPEDFIQSLRHTVKERFSEGASGAFFCESHDGKYVIKSMHRSEAVMLHRILPFYVQHLERHPESLLCKFFSCTALRLYRQTIYFVVMKNVFNTKNTVHERYDLKGSWIGRQSSAVKRGSQAHCRHCNEEFRVYYDKSPCPARPNKRHVANKLLLDEDLTFKLRLPSDVATRLGKQLRIDSKFLADMGIMDYSLLLGVHRRKFRLRAQRERPPHGVSNRAKRSRTLGQLGDLHEGGPAMHHSTSAGSAVGSRGAGAAGTRTHVPPHHVSVVGPSDSIHTSGGFMSTPSRAGLSSSNRAGGGAGGGIRTERDGAGVGAEARRDADTGTSTGASVALGGSADSRAARVLTPALSASPTPEAEMTSVPSTFNVDDEAPFFERYEGGIVPNIIEGPGVFYMGICDILQAWGIEKKAEQFWKRYLKCQDRHGLSCVPPEEYHRRFAERVVAEIIEQDERVEQPRSPTVQYHSHSYVLPRENRSFANVVAPSSGPRSQSHQVGHPAALTQALRLTEAHGGAFYGATHVEARRPANTSF